MAESIESVRNPCATVPPEQGFPRAGRIDVDELPSSVTLANASMRAWSRTNQSETKVSPTRRASSPAGIVRLAVRRSWLVSKHRRRRGDAEASVDRKNRARRVGAAPPGKEQVSRRRFPRGGQAGPSAPLWRPAGPHFVAERKTGHVGGKGSRRERVDRHLPAGEFLGQDRVSDAPPPWRRNRRRRSRTG